MSQNFPPPDRTVCLHARPVALNHLTCSDIVLGPEPPPVGWSIPLCYCCKKDDVDGIDFRSSFEILVPRNIPERREGESDNLFCPPCEIFSPPCSTGGHQVHRRSPFVNRWRCACLSRLWGRFGDAMQAIHERCKLTD